MVSKDPLEQPSTASHPGRLTLSYDKWRLIEPWMFGVRYLLWRWLGAFAWLDFVMVDAKTLKEHLACGDSRAAVVVSTSPLLVAAYSDDLDCVAMLRFPRRLARRFQFSVGSRLLTINTYCRQLTTQADLTLGPNHTGQSTGFFPLIGEFLSDDERRIETRKRKIDEAEWQRCRELGDAYLFEHPGMARGGRPTLAAHPAGCLKHFVIGTTVAVLGIGAFIVLAWMFL